LPSRRTVAVGEESFFKASSAFSALVSWIVPMIALRSMTPKMMTTSAIQSVPPSIKPITIEMMAAPARIEGHRVFEFADEDHEGALRLSSLPACSSHIWLSSRLDFVR
jgi:hypothetical protein